MLDVHALTVTPGAALVLGNDGVVSAGGDGAQTAGIPVGGSKAKLRMWGLNSPTADSIANIRLRSQDMVDPIDGIQVTPGAASLLCQFFDYTSLPYVRGTRSLNAGTNVGVVACTGFLIDEYPDGGQVVNVDPAKGNEVCVGATTFGGALTANTWGSVGYAAPNLPSGKYAIVGAFVSAIANNAVIRFRHNSFKGNLPGFPVTNYELALATTMQVSMRDELVQSAAGEQFIYLSEMLKSPQCPVFEVSNAGTGLTIEIISPQADTPVVNLVIVKVG